MKAYILRIEGLKIEASIGCTPYEHEVSQFILLDLKAEVDAAKAAETDDINHAVSYAEIAAHMTELTQSRHFKLVEHLAKILVDSIKATYPLENIELTIKKPNVLANTDFVGITVTA